MASQVILGDLSKENKTIFGILLAKPRIQVFIQSNSSKQISCDKYNVGLVGFNNFIIRGLGNLAKL